LLGELPPAEAELLRWTIVQDPELAKVHDRLQRTLGLVREVAANPDDATARPGRRYGYQRNAGRNCWRILRR